MKEATGELNMTIITVIAIAAIGVFLWAFLPGILEDISDNWGQTETPDDLQPSYNSDLDSFYL